MSETSIVALITAVLTFTASIYGAARVSHDNRDKTIRAVEDAIRSVKEDSKAQDQEIHAEILLFKQETQGAFDLIRKDITVLSDRVEKHNGVVERTFALEKKAEVMEEKQRVANHRIDDLERTGK